MKLPKTLRGVQYPNHIRINKKQLEKLFTNPAFRFTGFIVGNKVNNFHFFNGWHLAHRIEGYSKADMQSAINGFAFHLELELGNNVAIFVKRSAVRRSNDPVIVPSVPFLL